MKIEKFNFFLLFSGQLTFNWFIFFFNFQGAILFGQNPFPYLNMETPQAYTWATNNKVRFFFF